MNKNKPYFVVPDLETRTKALGSFSESSKMTELVYRTVSQFFPVIPSPTKSDWLYSQKELGQTYDQYLASEHPVVTPQNSTIYILPLEKTIPSLFLERLRQYCQAFYHGVKVVLLPVIDISKEKIASRVNHGKLQYDINEILEHTADMLPPDGFCLIEVCMTDLYPGEGWNFVFGGACPIIRKGVFSFARYDDRFFGEEKYEVDYEKILVDAIGVMVHEIGHMFGVEHCIYYSCIMNGANNLVEDRKNLLQLCAVCLRKFQSNVGFDILERYQAIKKQLRRVKGERSEKTMKLVDGIIERLLKEKKQ